jgi:NADH:ubiquinone oxidoreductase subunit C
LDNSKLQIIATKSGAQIVTSPKSTILTVPPEKVREICNLIITEFPEFYHLITITGVDTGSTIDVFYHFWRDREFLSVKTTVTKEKPMLDSISDFLSSSLLYEAEVKDLLGVLFNGNPLMGRKLLLPENYPPEAPPPLRKESDPEKIRKMMELE